jgi:large subunit ribosomal protein L29
MKIAEIRKMSEKELSKQLAALREQVRDLNFKVHSKEIKNNHLIKGIKRDIAKILTVINAK